MARMKRRVRSYYAEAGNKDQRDIGRLARTRTPCSCPLCSNPRQELRADEKKQLRHLVAEGARRNAKRDLEIVKKW